MTLPRLRQLVFASNDQADVARLREVLDLGEGFVDPDVSVFGLTNGVYALGDQFLEVVVPTQDNTAAGRFLARSGGQGGYMAIFQVGDIQRVRDHADAAKMRRVWNIDVDEISASHLHPADIGAAIVSIDEARPAESWRWGGPDWETNARPGFVSALEVVAVEPRALAQRWAGVLDVPAQEVGDGAFELSLDGGTVSFVPGERDYLSRYTLAHPEPEACIERARACGLSVFESGFEFAGVHMSLVPRIA